MASPRGRRRDRRRPPPALLHLRPEAADGDRRFRRRGRRDRRRAGLETAAAFYRYAAAMATTIAVLSQKGGTGKTTAVRTLAEIFRRIDLPTLAVDLDPQANLSDYFDATPETTPTVAELLTGQTTAAKAIY